MQTASFVEALQSDLRELASLGGDDVAAAADRLAAAIRSSAGLRLLDALSEAALEISAQLPSGHVDIRVAGQDPQFVYVAEEQAEAPAPSAEDGMTSRITLRLPESLKASVEAAAASEGVSVNTWLVRALQRAVAGGAGGGGFTRTGKRIQGFAQS
jgi:predicted DNA binding CopG/RHH family protein